MRGESSWSVAERELMAAMVATWNSCAFCVGAHSAIAVLGMDAEIVEACRADYRTAPISERLRETLRFLEKQTLDPAHLGADDARTAIAAGVSPGELTDAAAVGALFNIITRYANALDFAIPTGADFDKAARMLLKRGYS
nr:carboxymuconolactone decarboxylase family protein [Microbacterium humi]